MTQLDTKQNKIKEQIREIAQDLYQAGEEGEPEESAVPNGVDQLYSLYQEGEIDTEKIMGKVQDALNAKYATYNYEAMEGALLFKSFVDEILDAELLSTLKKGGVNEKK